MYDETADKRRKIAAKHTQEELQYYRRFLEQLLQAIRQSERTRVDEIIDIIRAGASDVEILTAVSRCLDTNLPKTEPEMDGYTLSDMGLDIMDENIMRNLDLESGFYNTGG